MCKISLRNDDANMTYVYINIIILLYVLLRLIISCVIGYTFYMDDVLDDYVNYEESDLNTLIKVQYFMHFIHPIRWISTNYL